MTEQQFLLLLISVPALISGILVYLISGIYRQRTVTSLQQQLHTQQQSIAEKESRSQQMTTDLALARQHIDQLESTISTLEQRNLQIQQHHENTLQDYHQAHTALKQTYPISGTTRPILTALTGTGNRSQWDPLTSVEK